MNGKKIMAGAMAALALFGFSSAAEAGTTTTTHTATRVSTTSAARSSSNAAARAAAASRASATRSAQARSSFSRSAATHSYHTQQSRALGINHYYYIASASSAHRQTTEKEQSSAAGHRVDAAYSIKPVTLNNICLETRYAAEKWNPASLRAAPGDLVVKISSLSAAFKKDGETFRQSAPVADRQLLAAALSCDMGL